MSKRRDPFDPQAFVRQLSQFVSDIPGVPPSIDGRKPQTLVAWRQSIARSMGKLETLSHNLDKVAHPDFVFDPSSPEVLGVLIALVLLEQPRIPLDRIPEFYGSGVYAIYYKGPFDSYAPISGTENPIYVGKADPKIMEARTPVDQGTKLHGRLCRHAKSIRATAEELKTGESRLHPGSLMIDDFECRYLVVKSAWQVTAETYLIKLFNPVWNKEKKICKGFGKHGDSAKVRKNTRSPWDTLHSGREWATDEDNVENPKTPEEIKADIAQHYRDHPPLELDSIRRTKLTRLLSSFSLKDVAQVAEAAALADEEDEVIENESGVDVED